MTIDSVSRSVENLEEKKLEAIDLSQNLTILSKLKMGTYLKVDLSTNRIDEDRSFLWLCSDIDDVIKAIDLTFHCAVKDGGANSLELLPLSYANLNKLINRYQGYPGVKEKILKIEDKYRDQINSISSDAASKILKRRVEEEAAETVRRTQSFCVNRKPEKSRTAKKGNVFSLKCELRRLLKERDKYQISDDLRELIEKASDYIRNKKPEEQQKDKFTAEIQKALKKLRPTEEASTAGQKEKVLVAIGKKVMDLSQEDLLYAKTLLKPIGSRVKKKQEEPKLVTSSMLAKARSELNKTAEYDQLIPKEQPFENNRIEPVLDLDACSLPSIASRNRSQPPDNQEFSELAYLDSQSAVIYILESLRDHISQLKFDVSCDESESWSSGYESAELDEDYFDDFELPEIAFKPVIQDMQQSSPFLNRKRKQD